MLETANKLDYFQLLYTKQSASLMVYTRFTFGAPVPASSLMVETQSARAFSPALVTPLQDRSRPVRPVRDLNTERRSSRPWSHRRLPVKQDKCIHYPDTVYMCM